MMKYVVSIGYRKFEFASDHTAMYFAQLAKSHSVDGETIEIELVFTEDHEDIAGDFVEEAKRFDED